MAKERVIIREYCESDIPELIELWNETFYDDKGLIEQFFQLLPKMGVGYVAVAGSRLLGMVYVLNFSVDGRVFGYIYALAVKEEYRFKGIGGALVAHCGRIHPRLCTLPADRSLYDWYAVKAKMTYRTFCRYDRIMPENSEGVIKVLSHTEYAAKRSEFGLETKYPVEWYEYQRELCRTYGGGMFSFGRSIACGYVERGVLKILECLGSSDFIPVLCYRLGAEYAEIRRPAIAGDEFICANVAIPDTLNLNLALD